MKQKWLPEIAFDLCTGCGDCVAACGPGSLALVDKVAMLVNPDTCGSEQHCIDPCAHHAIFMTWKDATGDTRRGKWRSFDNRRDGSNYPYRTIEESNSDEAR